MDSTLKAYKFSFLLIYFKFKKSYKIVYSPSSEENKGIPIHFRSQEIFTINIINEFYQTFD